MRKPSGSGAPARARMFVCLALAALCSLGASAPKPGGPAPGFALPGLFAGQKDVSLASLAGRPVLVDFWASWCPPCRKTLPHLGRLAARYPSLAVLAVSIDENQGKAREFLKIKDPSLVYLHDAGQASAAGFDLGGMPSLFLIDGKGVLRYRHDGYVEGDLVKIEAEIRALLEEK